MSGWIKSPGEKNMATLRNFPRKYQFKTGKKKSHMHPVIREKNNNKTFVKMEGKKKKNVKILEQ